MECNVPDKLTISDAAKTLLAFESASRELDEKSMAISEEMFALCSAHMKKLRQLSDQQKEILKKRAEIEAFCKKLFTCYDL